MFFRSPRRYTSDSPQALETKSVSPQVHMLKPNPRSPRSQDEAPGGDGIVRVEPPDGPGALVSKTPPHSVPLPLMLRGHERQSPQTRQRPSLTPCPQAPGHRTPTGRPASRTVRKMLSASHPASGTLLQQLKGTRRQRNRLWYCLFKTDLKKCPSHNT